MQVGIIKDIYRQHLNRELPENPSDTLYEDFLVFVRIVAHKNCHADEQENELWMV